MTALASGLGFPGGVLPRHEFHAMSATFFRGLGAAKKLCVPGSAKLIKASTVNAVALAILDRAEGKDRSQGAFTIDALKQLTGLCAHSVIDAVKVLLDLGFMHCWKAPRAADGRRFRLLWERAKAKKGAPKAAETSASSARTGCTPLNREKEAFQASFLDLKEAGAGGRRGGPGRAGRAGGRPRLGRGRRRSRARITVGRAGGGRGVRAGRGPGSPRDARGDPGQDRRRPVGAAAPGRSAGPAGRGAGRSAGDVGGRPGRPGPGAGRAEAAVHSGRVRAAGDARRGEPPRPAGPPGREEGPGRPRQRRARVACRPGRRWRHGPARARGGGRARLARPAGREVGPGGAVLIGPGRSPGHSESDTRVCGRPCPGAGPPLR